MGIRLLWRSPRGVLFLLMSCAFLSACAQVSEPPYLAVPGVQEIDLKWQPRAGMRLVYQVTMTMTVSGPQARSIPEHQRTQRRGPTTQVLEITDVGPEYYEYRLTQDGVTLPATVRFSRDGGTLLEIRLDDPRMWGSADPAGVNAAVRQISKELFTQAARFYRRWRLGETYRFELQFPGPPGFDAVVTVDATFRRVVMIHDRTAAEFEAKGSGGAAFQGSSGRISLISQEWVDLATGALLKSKEEGVGNFSAPSYQVRLETETVLDFTNSRF